MYKYGDGSVVVLVPTIVAMVLATPNSEDYDRTEANGILLELLKQRHPKKSHGFDGRTYEDFKNSEVEDAVFDLSLLRSYVQNSFLPQMTAKGFTSYDIEDECLNSIWNSNDDFDLEWSDMWRKLREIAGYTVDYLTADDEIRAGRFNNIESALFFMSSAHIVPKEKHSLYCIPVRFLPSK